MTETSRDKPSCWVVALSIPGSKNRCDACGVMVATLYRRWGTGLDPLHYRYCADCSVGQDEAADRPSPASATKSLWSPHEFQPMGMTPLACERCGRVKDHPNHVIATSQQKLPPDPPSLDELIYLIARAQTPGKPFTTGSPIEFETSDGALVVVSITIPAERNR